MPPRRRALIAALVAAAAAVNLVGVSRHLWPDPRDFAVRYSAGELVDTGRNPYDSHEVRRTIKAVEGDTYVERGLYGFVDPPPVAAFFRALSHVPFRAAVYLWFITAIVAAGALGWLTALLVGIPMRRPTHIATAAVLGFCFGPARYSVAGLQVDVVYGALGLGAAVLAGRQSRLVGPLAAIAGLKPQATAAAMVGVLARRRRFVTQALLSVLVLALVAAVAAPSATWPNWIAKASKAAHEMSAGERAALALLLVATVLVWARALKRTARDPVVTVAAAATVGVNLFALLHLNPFSAVLLSVPLALCVRSALDDTATWRRYASAMPVGLLAGGAVAPLTDHGGLRAAVLPLATVALLALAAYLWRPDKLGPIVLAVAVNAGALGIGLTQTGTRIAVAIASTALAALVVPVVCRSRFPLAASST